MNNIVIVGPNVGFGGVERASCNLANGLVNLGINVAYLALVPGDKFFELQANYLEPSGFNYKHINLLRTILYIRKTILKIKPDTVIAYTKFYAAVTNISLLFTRYRLIVTERSSPLYKWPKQVEIFCWLSFALRKPVGVISQTLIASGFHKKYYGRTEYITIPNALQDGIIYPQVERENWIVAAGRFNDPSKGFDLLVEAFNQVDSKDWNLVFVGGNEEEGKYLLDLARSETIRKKIIFMGRANNLERILARAGIFVLPSRSEGFPNVLAEALAAGCCCVSFDIVAGPRDLIINKENGILVPPLRTDLLSESLNELITNPDLRNSLSKKAVKVREQLSGGRIARMHLEFFETVSNKR